MGKHSPGIMKVVALGPKLKNCLGVRVELMGEGEGTYELSNDIKGQKTMLGKLIVRESHDDEDNS